MTTDARHRRAFTLIEAVLAMLFASVLVVGALNMAGSAVSVQRSVAVEQEAYAMAQDVMNEVLSAPYEDEDDGSRRFGVETNESSTEHDARDDVDDYHGLTRSMRRRVDPDTDGVYTYEDDKHTEASVTIEYVDPNDPSSVVFFDMGIKCITVTVTDERGGTITLTALRSRMGAMDAGEDSDADVAASIAITLQLGDDTDVQRTTKAAMLNRVSSTALGD